MSSTTAGPSQPHLSVVGLPIGALDPTQPARLLSSSGSKLSFATFHPLTATKALQKEHSRSDELSSKRRVVLETLSTGESFWRWVPRAKGVEAGGDEGEWPRVINICGQLVTCSQDQWDIYKLDPQYDCTVLPAPALSTITRCASDAPPAATRSSPSKATSKRAYVEDSSDDDLPMPGSIKKSRRAPAEVPEADEDFEDSDEEVEMIVESAPDLTAAREARRKKIEENRKKRRAKLFKTMEKKARTLVDKQGSQTEGPGEVQDLSMTDLTIQDTQSPAESQLPPYSNLPSFAHSTQPPSYTSQPAEQPPASSTDSKLFSLKRVHDSPDVQPYKRARYTQSPTSSRQEYVKKVSNRERFRQGKYNERLEQMRAERNQFFEAKLRAEFTQELRSTGSSSASGTTSDTAPSSPQDTQDTPVSEEDPISLEEKIRRIQEMNSYEQARRERDEAQRRAEAAEAEKKRKQEEALQRERERLERLQQEREREEERRRKEHEEETQRQRRAQEEAERRAKEQQRRAQSERYASGPWTPLRALERYRLLCDEFDAASFSSERPMQVEDVPWPVLAHPARFALEDVDWAAVEAFFGAVSKHMRAADFKTFVEKSHRRFHPDRWRGRRILQSIVDDELRACLEVAANTVAQAITPIWREAKSS
ncbi:hypothetical protein PsYK624_083920 [Phanerochaete sordida]|uniref:Uncharacterized protein n=1 Tax=Phanerochaete sordida TaxID=48140 RepID=A0A9P3GEF6_9APHY|nr:hypothetical protein PsYK624_083920 [Phanerochaete sordida]